MRCSCGARQSGVGTRIWRIDDLLTVRTIWAAIEVPVWSVTMKQTPEPHLTLEHSGALPEIDAAGYLGMSQAWLRKQRRLGKAPAYIRLGRRIVYQREDLDALFAAGRVDPERIK